MKLTPAGSSFFKPAIAGLFLTGSLLAGAAAADTDNASTDADDSEPAAAAAESEDEAALAKADAQSDGDDAATDPGSGSGDADASDPVAAPDGEIGDDTAAPERRKRKEGDKKEGAEPTAGAVAKDVKAPGKKKDGKGDGGGEAEAPAAMAAGGVVGGGGSFPLGITASLSNSIGSQTFNPGYTNNPAWNTSVNLRPRFVVPQWFDYQPRAMITGSMSANINWFSNNLAVPFAGPRDRQIRISDAAVSAIFPGLVKIPWVNVSITPILTGRIPLSVSSRFQQRVFGVGGAAMAGWNYSSFLGTIGAQYVPSGTYWEHLTDTAEMPCGEQYPIGGGLFGGTGFGQGNTDLPLAVGRVEEVTVNGQCKQAGRQLIGFASNTLGAFYALPFAKFGTHTIAGSFTLTYGMLRPLSLEPDLRSIYAQPQSYVSLVGFQSNSVSYTYGVPGAWMPFNSTAQITAGISSFGTLFDGQGFLRPPVDGFFWSPRQTGDSPVGLAAQNGGISSGFLTVTVGI